MGSPISVVIAEIVMQKLEEDIFNNSPCNIFCWKRYVDDCFAIIPTDFVERFLPYINSINGNLQFTNEIEDNGTLCYLDVKILRQEAGTFKFAIYRKTSNTGRLLDYDSYAPGIQKINVIKS